MNDPINLIDINGLQPGDSFSTAKAAAKDAIDSVNPQSIAEDTEYAGTIDKNDDGTYKASVPKKGSQHSSDFDVNRKTCRGLYHTHGADSPNYDDENFSPKDKAQAKKFKVPSFLGTPTGKFKTYNP